MKRLLLIVGLILTITVLGFSQATPVGEFRIVDATTAWGINLPEGTKIYNIETGDYYVLTAASVSTATLTTESNKALLNASGSDDQNLTWDAVNGHIEIESGNDADIGSFGTANTNYGFVIGSNGETTKFLRGDNSWQTVITTEVDGSITNEGDLTVVAGGANTSEINSNTSGSSNVVISGGTGITVTESGQTITIASSATIYTNIVEWDEASDNDLVPPYDITLSQTPSAATVITVQINGMPIKYAAGTDNGTFNYSGTTLSVYSPIYKYDKIEIHYAY